MGQVDLVLPKEYGFVAIVLVLYCLVNFWMAGQVGKARKRFNVPYPTLYALESDNKDAKLFNCVQRGHQNSLEMMPMHPCTCAALGLLYTVSRVFYFKGYATGDPQKRLTVGKYGFLALLGLMVSTVSFGVSLLL
ncbi:hypothetical protein I3842_Q134200 [Carya illinoinensis]|uniref:Glutathione S-transferase 3, mitochondrial n=1 Tax=Carya illinoinensis TaxID=32201 RepID=A0A922A1P1_CARIL|nr:hypothetical protein I3842_Q134200 [Carya illinoinensis]